jgi:hypothetical protein
MHNFAFCWMDSFKIIDTQQTKIFNKFKNASQKLLKPNVAICFNTIHMIYHLTPEYIQSLEYILLTNNNGQVKKKLALTLILNDGTNEKYHHNYLLN